ncbi:hypothetical protein ACFO3O_19400 [Dokdonia ponticola]|uniref:Uncharacterized protein n=1 Tax=Dokdonia ponticola TaxID=2041041 RepID=A0ABV9I1Q1_9FLAO
MALLRKNISDKLKSVFTDSLSEDERLSRHFIGYATSLAKRSHRQGVISLQIIQEAEELSATLFKGDSPIKTICLDEIALFFTNGFSASLIGKSIVEEKLKNYFKTFKVSSVSKSIGVRMVIVKEEQVKIYTFGTQCASEVLLSEFITFFKS